MKLGRYKHYKGNFYQTIGVALDTATRGKVVLYHALYDCPDLLTEYGSNPVFTRPYEEFFSDIEYDGHTMPRFEYMEGEHPKEKIHEVATGLLFDADGKLLIYLRDDKPTISFPNHWDLFGGFVEEGEIAEQALEREVMEEIGVTLTDYTRWKSYDCLTGDSVPNIKHVFIAHLDVRPE